MSALDDLLGEFQANAGTMPQVNPPEAAAVMAAQTAPEVAGAPEPAPADEAPPAPTEKPAEVKAAEQARTRKPRGGAKNAGGNPGLVATAPAPAAPGPVIESRVADPLLVDVATERLVCALQDRGYAVHLVAESAK